MTDTNNPGQFGNRDDTDEQAERGGEASSSKQDMSELGRRGGEAQSTEAERGDNQSGDENTEEEAE